MRQGNRPAWTSWYALLRVAFDRRSLMYDICVPRHHIIPKMAILRFADAGGKVLMISRDDLNKRVSTVARKACAEVGFNRIAPEDVKEEFRDLHDPEMIENALSNVEGAAKHVIDEILDGAFPLSKQARYDLGLFLSLQMSRGWAWRKQWKQSGDLIAHLYARSAMPDDKFQAFFSNGVKTVDPLAIREFRASLIDGTDSLTTSQSETVMQGIDLALNGSLRYILGRSWRVLKFPEPCLLTSDNPLGCWAPPGVTNKSLGVGNAPAVFYPIDRSTALSMTMRSVPERIVSSGLTRADQINYVVAREAEKWILHHPADNPLDGMDLPPRASITDEVVSRSMNSDGTVYEMHRFGKCYN